MKKRLFYSFLLIALSVNLFFGTHLYLRSAQAAEENDPRANIELFITVLEQIREQYVDGTNLTYKDLILGAIKGMISTLDPHSEFMLPEKYMHLQHDTEGTFGGVGIVISLREGQLTVIEPMEGTPAFDAGIIPNDRIVKIDGKSTENFDLEDAVKLLRGKPGSKVELTISRSSTSDTIKIELERSIIKVPKVKDSQNRQEFRLGEDGIGYIRLLQFDEQTSRDLEDALDKLERQGMKSLILDLRGNPGGLLDQAVRVCDKFLPRGELIVSTEGRNRSDNERFYASGRNKHLEIPMVILVNKSSASASEIVAGCMQDLGRAIIVGEKTFGKGSVQKILPLSGGGALRLTTSKYYTPSHKVIHGKGISPDIEVGMSEEEEQALFLKRMPGGISNIDEIFRSHNPEAVERMKKLVKVVRDRQLQRARDLLRGLNVYSSRDLSHAKSMAQQ